MLLSTILTGIRQLVYKSREVAAETEIGFLAVLVKLDELSRTPFSASKMEHLGRRNGPSKFLTLSLGRFWRFRESVNFERPLLPRRLISWDREAAILKLWIRAFI